METGGTVINVSSANENVMDVHRDPEEPGRRAYQRYLHSSDGVSLISGNKLPGFEELSPEIKRAWCAAADPRAPRLLR